MYLQQWRYDCPGITRSEDLEMHLIQNLIQNYRRHKSVYRKVLILHNIYTHRHTYQLNAISE